MARNKKLDNKMSGLMTLPSMLKDQRAQANIMNDHGMVGQSSGQAALTNIVNNNVVATNLVATDGDFDNINVSKDIDIAGNVTIKGQLKAKSINMDSTEIILSMDYGRITENFKHMSESELEHLKIHLTKVEMMIEKEMFERT